MASRAFSTRTYPTFGTNKRPKPPSSWERSVYFWWWEYLRRNEEYKKCCSSKGKGRLSNIYAHFGDVHTSDFKEWWGTGERGNRLFSEPTEPQSLREVSPGEIQGCIPENCMLILVPMSQTKRHLIKRFSTLLKQRHTGSRGKRMLHNSKALFPLAGQFTIHSLKSTLRAYDLRVECPQLTLWQIALQADLAPTVQLQLRESDLLPDADQRNILNVAASRAIKRAKIMIVNTAKGVFPYAKAVV